MVQSKINLLFFCKTKQVDKLLKQTTIITILFLKKSKSLTVPISEYFVEAVFESNCMGCVKILGLLAKAAGLAKVRLNKYSSLIIFDGNEHLQMSKIIWTSETRPNR